MQFLNTVAAFGLLAATAVVASPTPSGLECRRPPRPCNKDIVFTLSDITYESNYVYSTPAHLATSLGTIKFNLTNPAEPYVTHCMAQSTRYSGFFYGDQTYTCATHPGAAPGVGANFTFSAPSGHITIDQTWSCGKTSQYLGYGAGNVTLDCKTTNYQNSNWSIGQIYSSSNTVCKPTQLQLPATVFTKKNGTDNIIAADHMGVTITDRVY